MQKYHILVWLCAGAIFGSSLSVQGQQLGKTQLVCRERADAIAVSLKSLDETLKDDKGTAMLQVTGNLPVVEIPHQVKATKKINAFYNSKLNAFNKLKKSDFEIAQDDYGLKSEEEKAYWQGYGLGMRYTEKRADAKVLSLVEDNYEYMGGAHPNSVRAAQNFESNTGKLLKFKDVVTDEAAARAYINNYILEALQTAEYKDYVFEDYKNYIDQILKDDTWYLSAEGLVIIVNEYIITPHVVGILEFTIPYSDFPYLKADYQPVK